MVWLYKEFLRLEKVSVVMFFVGVMKPYIIRSDLAPLTAQGSRICIYLFIHDPMFVTQYVYFYICIYNMLQVLFLLFYTLFGLDNAQYVWLNIPISNTQTFSFICVEIINGTSSVVLLLQYNKLEIFKSAQLQPHGVALDCAGAVPAGADRPPRLRLHHPRRGHREVPVCVPARQVTI